MQVTGFDLVSYVLAAMHQYRIFAFRACQQVLKQNQQQLVV